MRLGAAFTRTLPGQKKKIRYVIADGDEDTVLTLEGKRSPNPILGSVSLRPTQREQFLIFAFLEAYDRDPWEWAKFCMQQRP